MLVYNVARQNYSQTVYKIATPKQTLCIAPEQRGVIETTTTDNSVTIINVQPNGVGLRGPKGEAGTNDWNDLINKPTFSDVALSGDYDDLNNKPQYLSDFEDNLGSNPIHTHEQYATANSLSEVATTGSYLSLTNKPEIPTKTSDLNNDSGFVTVNNVPVKDVQVNNVSVVQNGIAYIQAGQGSVTDVQVSYNSGQTWESTLVGSVAKVLVPTSGGGSGGEINVIEAVQKNGATLPVTNKTVNVEVPIKGSISSVDQGNNYYASAHDVYSYVQDNKSSVKTVSINGSAVTPDSSGNVNVVTPNADWNSSSGVTRVLNKPTSLSQFTDNLGSNPVHTHSQYAVANSLSTVATSGSYDDLTNKPTIPTKTSDLTNDSGFITTQVNADWNANSGAAQILNKPEIPVHGQIAQGDTGYVTGGDVYAWNPSGSEAGVYTYTTATTSYTLPAGLPIGAICIVRYSKSSSFTAVSIRVSDGTWWLLNITGTGGFYPTTVTSTHAATSSCASGTTNYAIMMVKIS